MLIIFDVDGTLVGGEANDWSSFEGAITSVLGFVPTSTFFTSLTEITAQAIAEAAILRANREVGIGLEERIRDDYLNRLANAHAANHDAFLARSGAAELLAHLSALPGVTVAIATGDWFPTISLKLRAAGIDVARFPMATGSDCSRRAGIIRLAAQRAQRPLEDAIYVGDGVWDHVACLELGIPFIGTGSRPHRLREVGVKHIVEVFEIPAFMDTLQVAARRMPPRQPQTTVRAVSEKPTLHSTRSATL